MASTLHVLPEPVFKGALIRERRRADRSNRPLALVLVTMDSTSSAMRQKVVEAVSAAKDDTQIIGWFDGDKAIGLLAPELSMSVVDAATDLEDRVRWELGRQLDASMLERVEVDVHAHGSSKRETGGTLPSVDPLIARAPRRNVYDVLKRALDLAGSLSLLMIMAPVLAVIAALVKLKSPGPVFFRQVRVGQGMKPFTMLKFRTMRMNAGHATHHEFVTAFIKAGSQAKVDANNGMFKIADDPRVTSIGRILRKTSLDELPQLWNVVRGEMSLVGPRPPLHYEVEEYQPWHCRRVLEAKPGITGLWQVAGRSRTTFDDMVRLDLRYARARSVMNDIKILLATPAAVIVGKGAA